MTKKDYERIARVLIARRDTDPVPSDVWGAAYQSGHNGALREVAQELATVLAQENPRFDRARLLAAAGVQS